MIPIESTPHVLEGVTDDNAQERRGFLAYLRPEETLAATHIRLVGDSVRLSGGESSKLVTEYFQVVTCSLELEASTGEGVGHADR